MDDALLRRGLSGSGGVEELLTAFELPDIGSLGTGSALSWEDACRCRAACVVLNEEDLGTILAARST